MNLEIKKDNKKAHKLTNTHAKNYRYKKPTPPQIRDQI